MRLILIISIISMGCQPVNKDSVKNKEVQNNEVKDDLGETGCTYQQTSQSPENTYPFNKSDQIELIAYTVRDQRYKDTLIEDGKFNVKNITQRISLNNIQTDSLFSILYHYGTIRYGNVELSADCYNPRHSIVFSYNGKAFAYYEICFECYKTEKSKDVPYLDFCDEKWCMLQRFFKDSKITSGIVDEFCP